MEEEKIRIRTSIPGLADKIKTNIDGFSEVIYWYIKFNIPLDEASVSDKSMDVTDTEGYIMRTKISYNHENNMIVISPLDSYEQNRYYLLSISKKVRSEKGQYLKREIHILFKLLNNRISEYRILKPNVVVPKPQRRPKDYEQKYTKSKVYSFDTSAFTSLPPDRMPMADIKINFIIGVVGLLVTLASIPLHILAVTFAGLAVCLVGVGHIVFQLTRVKMRSVLSYNAGVRRFNKGKYNKAENSFKKAIEFNPENEMAEYALNKLSYYL